MTGPSFQGDPAALRAFMDTLDGVADKALAIGKDFRDELGPNQFWYGQDDEYARSAGPQFRHTTQTLGETFVSLSDAVIGINNGRRQELYTINDAQNFAEDQINRLKGKTDNVTNPPGGGKH